MGLRLTFLQPFTFLLSLVWGPKLEGKEEILKIDKIIRQIRTGLLLERVIPIAIKYYQI